MLKSKSSKTVPVFWFALALLLGVGNYWVTFSSREGQLEYIESFMLAGDRFTRADGDALEARIFLLELQVEELDNGKWDKEEF